MIEAYKQGQDLYAVIGQGMYNNNYEDNLEFYPEGTEIELDGKKIICGKKTHLHKEGKERRASAKTMLLAATYGMSGKTAGIRMGYKDIDKDHKEATEKGTALLNNFFNSFKSVEDAIKYSKERLKKVGYVEDWAGRRRHLPEINLKPYEVKLKDDGSLTNFNPFIGCQNKSADDNESVQYWWAVIKNRVTASQNWHIKQDPNWKVNDEMSNKQYKAIAALALVGKPFDKYKGPTPAKLEPVIITANTGRRAQAERQCFNARIQGGAASLTKLAMVNIENDQQMNDWDAHLVITVHDEVLVECPAFYSELVEKRLPQIMIDTAKPYINVPMSCDPANESRWYASEFSVALEEEFKHLEEKLTREEALNKLCKNHSEVPNESIIKLITGQTEQIEF